MSLFSFGQEGDELYDHRLDENKWEDLRDGIRYEGQEEDSPGRRWTYESDEDYKKAVEQSKKKKGDGEGKGSGDGDGGSWDDGDGSEDMERENSYSPPPDAPNLDVNPGGLSAIGYIMLILLGIGLAILIYYMFLNAPRDGKKVIGEFDLEETDPTEIPLTELQRMLQDAIASGDYRGAVRIYFIFIIKDLAEKGWIRWEKEKTNFHYLREMSGKNEFDDFNRSVSYFEIIWYGKRDLDANKFEQVRPNFTRFLDKLGVK